MKISSKDLVLITTTMFITSVATAFITTSYYDSSSTVLGTTASERITWEETRTLQDEYLDFKPLKVSYKNPDGTDVVESLKGFVFSAEHLNEIIHSNLSIPSGSSEKPDEVYFMLGQDGTFSDPSGETYGNIRLTAIGMKDKTLLTSSTTGGTSVSLFDKADPCPPNCPD